MTPIEAQQAIGREAVDVAAIMIAIVTDQDTALAASFYAVFVQGILMAQRHPEYAAALLMGTDAYAVDRAAAAADSTVQNYPITVEAAS